MILHDIRSDVPKGQDSHFLPIYEHESEWKTAVNFSAPDDPYVLVTRADGHILWRTHGPASNGVYAELKASVAKLSGQ